jgi:hypothetical protein
MPSITRLNSQAEALAQFKQFTDFARTSGGVRGQTAVQVGGRIGPASNGAFASISAKSRFDFIGNIGRRQQSKDVNDDVRDLFKETVLKMCGCANEQQLPDKVKEAMKFSDYNQGKPLTARRILAVQTAMRQHALEEALDAAGIKLDDTIRGRIKTAVSACKGDEDAFAVLQETWKEVLFEPSEKGRGNLRGNWAVRNRVGALVSDIQSLRTITGADKDLFNAAKPFLALKGRGPLSTATLVTMVAEVQKLQPGDLDPICELASRNPTASDVHAASLKLNELINRVMDGCVLARPNGLLHKNRTDYREQLIASMILTKAIPNKSSLNAVHAFLQSDEVRALRSLYMYSTVMVNPKANAMDCHLADILGDVSLHVEMALNTLKRAVDQRCDGVLSKEQRVEAYLRDDLDVNAPPSQAILGKVLAMAQALQKAKLDG